MKLRQDNVDIAYPPIIQSGGDYDLKVGAASVQMQTALTRVAWHPPVILRACAVHRWVDKTMHRAVRCVRCLCKSVAE